MGGDGHQCHVLMLFTCCSCSRVDVVHVLFLFTCCSGSLAVLVHLLFLFTCYSGSLVVVLFLHLPRWPFDWPRLGWLFVSTSKVCRVLLLFPNRRPCSMTSIGRSNHKTPRELEQRRRRWWKWWKTSSGKPRWWARHCCCCCCCCCSCCCLC